MKLVLKIGIYLMLIFLIYQAILYWGPIVIQKNTVAFLEKVKEQKYDDALTLFSGATDIKNWTDGMQKLHDKEGFRLLSNDNVKVDASFSTGYADLTFEVDSKPLKVTVALTFGLGSKPRQICAIYPPGAKPGSIPELDAWNELVCSGSF